MLQRVIAHIKVFCSMFTHRLVNCISAHSWSPDQATLALCPDSSEILVYHASEHGNIKKHCVLKQHSQVVSSIDWNREGSFASCSHDASAYVWSRTASGWTPELVCDPFGSFSDTRTLLCQACCVLAIAILQYTSPGLTGSFGHRCSPGCV